MIKMYTARTSEIDEFEEAITKIKSQIDFTKLKKHTSGIILCHMDFIESGMLLALCEALPFEIIGMTSMANACSQGFGFFDLSLTVLTSDEVSFTVGMTNGINRDNYEDEITKLYKNMRGKVKEDPSLIISFMPFVRDLAGYEAVAAADKAVGGIPIWGSVSSSLNFNYDTVKTICNGNHEQSGVAMLFLNGEVNPRYIVKSLPEQNISKTRGIITKSNGAILQEINDIPVSEYFGNMGIMLTLENLRSTPLVIYYSRSTEPITLAFYTAFDDGSILMGGEVPVGASVALGGIDEDTIIASCNMGIDEILKIEDRQAVLMLPCVTRGIMMLLDTEGEMKLIRERLSKEEVPFVMGYAGGEICPMPIGDTTALNEGKLRNCFHNYTFNACVL